MAIRPLTTNVSDLLVDTFDTNISLPAYLTDTLLTVYSISNFSTNQVLLVGSLGSEGSELTKTSASVAPSSNTITLASALTKNHPADVKVFVLAYDQIEFSTAMTETGTKTVLETLPIDPEKYETQFNDTTGSIGYYFTRYKNSITSTFSDYSDPIPVDGLASDTVGYIIEIAMKESQKEFTSKLTYETLTREINECLRYVRGKLKRWSSSQVFDKNIGQANRGIYFLPLPDDYYDKNSNKSCLSVRIGNQNNLVYVDKIEFDNLMEDVTVSTTTSSVASSSTSLVLINSADFPQSGSVSVYVNNVLQTVNYTSNDLSTNTLSGIPVSGDGSITTTIPANTNIWYGMNEGTANWFTIYNGNLYFWNPTDETINGRTVYMNYWTDITEVDSEADIIPLAKFDMVKHWLKWVIRNITERNGRPDINDQDFQMFNIILEDAKRRETTGQKFKMMPKINGIKYRGNVNSSVSYDNYLRN